MAQSEQFNGNFRILIDHLQSMDKWVENMSSLLFEHIDGAAEVDIPELRVQVKALQVEGHVTKVEVVKGALGGEKREIRKSVEMVEDTCG